MRRQIPRAFARAILASLLVVLWLAGPALAGPGISALLAAFGGPVQCSGATANQVPTKQTDGSWKPGTPLADPVTGAHGGTDQAGGYTVGDILYASGASTLSKLAAGTSTYVLTSNGPGVAPSYQAAGGGGGGGSPLYNDGSDGAVTLDGTSTFSGIETHTGSAPNFAYTLVRDVNATTFTVSTGKTCNANGCVVYATTSATVNGTLSWDGLPGANASGTSGGAGAAPLSPAGGYFAGYQQNAPQGGNGGNAGANGNAGAGNAPAAGGNGGNGGNAAVHTHGAGGTNTYGATFGTYRNEFTARTACTFASGPAVQDVQAGAAGGGGGADTGSGGGGGGGGGAYVGIFSPTITVGASGTISAQGGQGGAGSGTSGGGGGGGGGGVIWLVCTTHTNNGTETVAGGAHGNGAGTGANGSNGSAGNVVPILSH
jgi:hypothetical protein